MLFFRKRKSPSPVGIRTGMRDNSLETTLDQVLSMIAGRHWLRNRSLNSAQGLVLGGVRTCVLTSNDSLLEQAQALSLLSQRMVPMVLHVLDYGVGNNQTLRLPFFRFFAGSAQESVDFSLIAQRLAELSLQPVMVVHSIGATSFNPVNESDALQYLGREDDLIPTPTASQEMLFGAQRRCVPMLWNPQDPLTIGLTMPSTLRDRQWAARQAFFAAHLEELLEKALQEFAKITGRRHEPCHFQNNESLKQVVTTDAVDVELDKETPLIRIRYITTALRKELQIKQLAFIDRNHARALSVALQLEGFSLVHYGPIDLEVVQQALALNENCPMDTAKSRFRFTEPVTPLEEIHNQRVARHYPHLRNPETLTQGFVGERPRQGPPALERHPRNSGIPAADLHAYWNLNGKYFASGFAEQVICTPLLASGLLPAGSGKMLPLEGNKKKHRVVTSLQFVETLVECLIKENYAYKELQRSVRSIAQSLESSYQSAIDFSALLNQLDLHADIQKQWKNALHFAPIADCSLVSPFKELGGILVLEKSIEHGLFLSLLPNTPEKFIIDSSHLLLDHDAEQSYVRREETPAERVSHLLSAVATRESKLRGQRFVALCQSTLESLRQLISSKLSLSLSGDLEQLLGQMKRDDLTLAELAQKLDRVQAPVDRQWLLHIHQLEQKLSALCQTTPASFGWVSQGASGVYPWSPVMVPWAQSGTGGIDLALGIWEAQMAKVCQDFVALRKAQLEVKGLYQPKIHEPWFAKFDWRQLNEEELLLCPPLLLVGTDQDFLRQAHSLGELFRHGAPIKVIVFDSLNGHPASSLQHILAHDILLAHSSLIEESHLIDTFAWAFQSAKAALIHVLCPARQDPTNMDRMALEWGMYPHFRATDVNHFEMLKPCIVNEEQTWADLLANSPRFFQNLPVISIGGITVAQWLTLDAEDRLESTPVVLCRKDDGTPIRCEASAELIRRAQEHQRYIQMLLRLSQVEKPVEIVDPVEELTRKLMELAKAEHA